MQERRNIFLLYTYKFRLYPNKTQEILLQKTFGCVRFVYNQCLAHKIEVYQIDKTSLSSFDLMKYNRNVLKTNYEWLKEVDKFALDNAIINLDTAYKNFFKRGNKGFPKYKRKRNNHKSYHTNYSNNNIEIKTNKIKLPKLKWVKCKVHQKVNGTIKSATVSQTSSGKYFVSVLVEREYIPMESTGAAVGIDLRIKDLVITSDGKTYKNPHVLKQYEKQLAKLQRQLSKKKVGSYQWNKQRIKVARYYEKISNIRKDYLHKISHELIKENQIIISENLKISNMLKNHRLAKAISDVSWYELTRQLQYKAAWNGRQYIKIDTYFPSSQLCSNCGYQNTNTKDLSVREWTCPVCGIHHDRDINAAINILHKGLESIS